MHLVQPLLSSPHTQRTSIRSCSFVAPSRLRPPPRTQAVHAPAARHLTSMRSCCTRPSHLRPPPRVSAPTATRRHLASNAPTPTQIIPVADAHQKQDGSSNDFRKKKSRLGHNPGVAGRQFLTHPGVPAGTMFAREEMAIKKRMIDTRESVQKHLSKRFGAPDELLEEQGEDAQNRMERGRRTGVASLVEERIQLSMIRGEFANLKHKGKLERERTPGLDRTTDIFMEVMQRNGVLPEWIQRQKRVNSMTDLLRRRLEVEYARACMDANPQLELVQGDVPLARTPSLDSFTARVHRINSIAEDCAVINSEILTYNLQGRVRGRRGRGWECWGNVLWGLCVLIRGACVFVCAVASIEKRRKHLSRPPLCPSIFSSKHSSSSLLPSLPFSLSYSPSPPPPTPQTPTRSLDRRGLLTSPKQLPRSPSALQKRR
jgi:hypothetical protein